MKCCNLFYLLSIFLIIIGGCKKNDLTIPKSNLDFNEQIGSFREGKDQESQIRSWMESQKQKNVSSNFNNFITAILSALDFNNAMEGSYLNNGTLVSIPITKLISIHSNTDDQTYLVIIKDSNKIIKRGEVVIVRPNKLQHQPVLNVTALDLYLGNRVGFYGQMILINFHDLDFADYEFQDALSKATLRYGNRVNNELYCVHWYLVTTEWDVFTGEITGQWSEDLGITCSSCQPNQLCDEFDDPLGGGGGNIDSYPDTIATNAKNISLWSVSETNNYFRVYSDYYIVGVHHSFNSSQNEFLSLSRMAGLGGDYFGRNLQEEPWHSNHCDIGNELDHHETHQYNYATATTGFELIYTHHSSSGGPVIEYHTGSHVFPNTIF